MNIHVCEENGMPLSNHERKVIKMFESDGVFAELINQARVNIGLETIFPNFPTPEIYKNSLVEARKIINIYNLPDSWVISVQFLIVTDKFFSFGDGIYLSGEWDKPQSVEISISQYTSIDNLKAWIQKHSNIIQKRLDKLPRSRRTPIIKEDKDLEFRCNMYRLAREGNKPKKIASILAQQYKDDPYLFSLIDSYKISGLNLAFMKMLHGKSTKAKLK